MNHIIEQSEELVSSKIRSPLDFVKIFVCLVEISLITDRK